MSNAAKVLALSLLILAALSLAACGGGEEARPPATGTPSPSASPVAVETEDGAAPVTLTPSAEASSAPYARLGLTWYGHSMFLLQSPGGVNILTDPSSGIGYPKPALPKIDVVTVSHDHFDHNKVDVAGKDVRVLNGIEDGDWEDIDETIGDVHIRTIPTFHDDQQGSQRGKNSMFLFDVGDMRLLFVGDLGHVLTDEQLAAVGEVDVLLLPVGGGPTIGPAEATQVVEQLKPRLAVPMHYKTDVVDFSGSDKLQGVELFLEGKTVERLDTNFAVVDKAGLPEPTTVLLMPYQ